MSNENNSGIDTGGNSKSTSNVVETLANPFEPTDPVEVIEDEMVNSNSNSNSNSVTETLLNHSTPNHITRSKSTPNTPKQLRIIQNTYRRISLDDNDLLKNHKNYDDEHITNLKKFQKTILKPVAKWAITPINKIQKSYNNKLIDEENNNDNYHIEYSVFRPLITTKRLETSKDILTHWRDSVELTTQKPFEFPENYINQLKFNKIVKNIKNLIEIDHIYPERNLNGSSGSYFVFQKIEFEGIISYEKIGIFKPKSEEPYGPLSPKWIKWLHRTSFPCFFGRSCLIPNLGYISEAATSELDQLLQSYIVPFTEIIELRSPTFYYPIWDRSKNVQNLPFKIGSLQLFLKGYKNADLWFKIYPIPTNLNFLPKNSNIEVNINELEINYKFQWSQNLMLQFQEEIEKMVILDYLIRNTDRGADNWMIKIEWEEINRNTTTKTMKPVLKIGAIDSGLAFPWKHPNEWRSFPYGWLFLPLSIIGQPFTTKTRNHYLPLLTSKIWWENTVINLKKVFMKDKDFKERMWLKQLAVLKGQAFNIVEVLKLDYAGPLELTRRERLLVFDDIMYIPENENDRNKTVMNTSNYQNDITNGQILINERSDEVSQSDDEVNQRVNERTTLLPKSQDHHQHQNHLQQIDENQEYESGFERMNKQLPSPERKGRKVIMERIVKEHSNPPVFTWC
ncbi:LSB6 [Candida pseudojiufengensis]|uniref:LSB6 n=1 Tax=Candida pseudojiufengensis TaxID=497109 RepID=UPI0022256AB4|nr:LSB6 [Candida pseudojiufengensis]KAI5966380.1 LSB6 [Candida pseudojiufengensis]